MAWSNSGGSGRENGTGRGTVTNSLWQGAGPSTLFALVFTPIDSFARFVGPSWGALANYVQLAKLFVVTGGGFEFDAALTAMHRTWQDRAFEQPSVVASGMTPPNTFIP
jgi:hypothetical protein